MPIEYRFLPWTRRGLARAHAQVDGAANLNARPLVSVGLTLQADEKGALTTVTANQNVRLYGPGDIVGIDTRLIVRTDPKPFTTNFEPNYLAVVDFDPPDLPWMFTPTHVRRLAAAAPLARAPGAAPRSRESAAAAAGRAAAFDHDSRRARGHRAAEPGGCVDVVAHASGLRIERRRSARRGDEGRSTTQRVASGRPAPARAESGLVRLPGADLLGRARPWTGDRAGRRPQRRAAAYPGVDLARRRRRHPARLLPLGVLDGRGRRLRDPGAAPQNAGGIQAGRRAAGQARQARHGAGRGRRRPAADDHRQADADAVRRRADVHPVRLRGEARSAGVRQAGDDRERTRGRLQPGHRPCAAGAHGGAATLRRVARAAPHACKPPSWDALPGAGSTSSTSTRASGSGRDTAPRWCASTRRRSCSRAGRRSATC